MNTETESIENAANVEYDIQTLSAKVNPLVGQNIMFRNSKDQICVVKVDAIVVEQKDGKPILHLVSKLGNQTVADRKMLDCIMIFREERLMSLADLFDELDIPFN